MTTDYDSWMCSLFDAAAHAVSFKLESAGFAEWARDYLVDSTVANVHIRLPREDFRRGLECGFPGSDHPKPWDVPSRADMNWGQAVVGWLDSALLSGAVTDASVFDNCGVLYFTLDERGFVQA